MSNICIKSVDGFLKKAKEYDLFECITRGECREFKCIQSGAFRFANPRKNRWVIRQYYNIVGNTLTELQKIHFTAFSQHYGIPTNLIDFTDSPLIALFFACQDSEVSKRGYVHFIRNNKLIDISDNVEFINEKNYLGQVLSFSNDYFDVTFNFVKRVLELYLFDNGEDVSSLNSAISDYIDRATDALHRKRQWDVDFTKLNYNVKWKDLAMQLVEQSERVLSEEQYEFLVSIHKKIIDDYIEVGLLDTILTFLIMLRAFHMTFDEEHAEDINYLNLPFYIVYRPPLIVPRVEKQSSVFIQQQYLEPEIASSTFIYDVAIQKIIPDKTFEVTHKDEILSDLDKVGINERTVFNDYDSIAKYVKRKIFDKQNY